MKLRPAGPADVRALAAVHATSFDAPWAADDFAALMAPSGTLAVLVEDDGPIGFVMIRVIAGDAEVLTLAVDPARRRSGVGRALMSAGLRAAAIQGADAMFLEVAVDNPAAVALYESLGFETAGRRPAYYRRAAGMVDAVILRRSLNTDGQ
jgi:ribosomal-protein-alanine N-acetyltransferase